MKTLQEIKNELARKYNKKADVHYDDWHDMEVALSRSINGINAMFSRYEEVAELYATEALKEAAEKAKVKAIYDYSLEVKELTGYRVDKESILSLIPTLK